MTPVRRNEDPRLLRGLGAFVDDIDPPGVLHAAILRAHGGEQDRMRFEEFALGFGPCHLGMAIGLLRACGNTTHDRVVNSVLYSAAGEVGNARVTTRGSLRRITTADHYASAQAHSEPSS